LNDGHLNENHEQIQTEIPKTDQRLRNSVGIESEKQRMKQKKISIAFVIVPCTRIGT
jgi:hypothetical protein